MHEAWRYLTTARPLDIPLRRRGRRTIQMQQDGVPAAAATGRKA